MRIVYLAIALLICTNAQAQIIRAEPFYVAPEEAAPAANLLLDSFPGAAVAYSLRKLDKDYTGSAIRVRRSSDNTEQDIGFVNNYLDTAAMKTFVGANDGFVVTWYNQADSAGVFGVKNAISETATAQPAIIISGNIFYKNATISIEFDGASDSMYAFNTYNYLNNVHNGSEVSLYVLAAVDNVSNARSLISNNDLASFNTGFSIYQQLGSARLQVARSVTAQVAVFSQVSQTSLESFLHFVNIDADNATASMRSIHYINGGSGNSTNGLTNAPSANNSTFDLKLGHSSANGFFDGSIKEIVIYNVDKSSSRTAIRDNINSFYSIY